MVLDDNLRIFRLYLFRKLGEEGRTADSRHVLEADFVGTVLNELVHELQIVLHGVDGRMRDRKSGLRDHARLPGVLYGELEVAGIVESAERTGDIGSLSLLDLEHQLAHIGRNRIHPERVQSPFEHMGLDSRLMERSRPLAHGDIGVLSIEEVHLFERAAVGLHTVEAAHVYNGRRNPYELVDSRLVLAGRLPHISVNEREFNFFCHIYKVLLYSNRTNITDFSFTSLAGNKNLPIFAVHSNGAISSVGRALDCGSRCRGFEPHIAPARDCGN